MSTLREVIERTKDVLCEREEARATRRNVTKFHRDRDIRALIVAAERWQTLTRLAVHHEDVSIGFLSEEAGHCWTILGEMAEYLGQGETLDEAIDAARSAS